MWWVFLFRGPYTKPSLCCWFKVLNLHYRKCTISQGIFAGRQLGNCDIICRTMEKEAQIFEKNNEEWIKSHEGQFVWINGEDFEFFDTYEDAVKNAYRCGFESKPIFVRQVGESIEPFVAGFFFESFRNA